MKSTRKNAVSNPNIILGSLKLNVCFKYVFLEISNIDYLCLEFLDFFVIYYEP